MGVRSLVKSCQYQDTETDKGDAEKSDVLNCMHVLNSVLQSMLCCFMSIYLFIYLFVGESYNKQDEVQSVGR